MDPMTGILCGAIAALWAYVVFSGKRCEARNDSLSREIKETKDAAIARSEKREVESREQTAMIATTLHSATGTLREVSGLVREVKELNFRTVRALRRYAGDRTPGDGTKDDDSETSRFFQVDPLEPK